MTDQEQKDTESIDDIELAYREAMKSLDEAEAQVGSAFMELAESDDSAEADDAAFTSIGEELAADLSEQESETTESIANGDVRVSPRSVIEAALFVGGDVALTGRSLASLIGKDTEAKVAVRIIDELNEDYALENRPYEIRLREGGFGIELKEQFATVQMKVFGMGPRDVRLSPDIMEILAFVAYNQPVTKEDLATIDKKKAMAHLRRLIRLQLVEVVRTGKKRSDVAYETGQKFLDVFGLSDLNELPQSDVFSFK